MSKKSDETALDALNAVLSYVKPLRITRRSTLETYRRVVDRSSDMLIDAPFSDDVKHCMKEIINVSTDNYLNALLVIKANRARRRAKLRRLALSFLLKCVEAISRKK